MNIRILIISHKSSKSRLTMCQSTLIFLYIVCISATKSTKKNLLCSKKSKSKDLFRIVFNQNTNTWIFTRKQPKDSMSLIKFKLIFNNRLKNKRTNFTMVTPLRMNSIYNTFLKTKSLCQYQWCHQCRQWRQCRCNMTKDICLTQLQCMAAMLITKDFQFNHNPLTSSPTYFTASMPVKPWNSNVNNKDNLNMHKEPRN